MKYQLVWQHRIRPRITQGELIMKVSRLPVMDDGIENILIETIA